MRLVCPNCKANYEIPRDAVPISGREVKCASCGHSWFQARMKKSNDAKLKEPESKFIEENSIEIGLVPNSVFFSRAQNDILMIDKEQKKESV